MEQLFSPKSLACHLGLAEQTIYNRHSTGRDLPRAIKLGHLLRFHPVDVEAWLEAKRQSGAVAITHPATGQPSSAGPTERSSADDQVALERLQ